MMINPPPVVVGPCRHFAFAGALMALLVLIMHNQQNLGATFHSAAMTIIDTKNNAGSASPWSSPSTMNMSDTTKNSKPTMLLHLGPHKTSTSFLQCILTNMMDTLALDNYVYFGRHMYRCFKNEGSLSKDTFNERPDFPFEQSETGRLSTKAAFSPTFLNELRETHSQGKNAIIMDEGFSVYTPEQTKLLIDEFSSNWNVKLILNYRRHYESLPSQYNQRRKPNKPTSGPSSTLWPGETNEHGVVGKPLLPFSNHCDGTTPPVEELRQQYPFPDLTNIILHDLDRASKSGDAVLQEMFCHIVDSMPHSCAAVQLNETVKIGGVMSNPYYSFNYDILATAAYEKQLFGFQNRNEVTRARRDVANLIQHHQEDTLHLTFNDFATICLAKEKMDCLLNGTITSEKVVYGSNWTSQHEVNLRQAFWPIKKKDHIYIVG